MESDIVGAICPDCQCDEAELLRETEHNVTLRCIECKHVWTFNPPKERTIHVRLIVSNMAESHYEQIEVVRDDEIRVGDDFQHDGERMLVTDLQLLDERHVKKAKAYELRAIFCKLFNEVPLKISVNRREKTKSYEELTEPEREVWIGEIIEMEGRKFIVKTIKSDQNRTINKGFLFAKNIRRVFCDDAPEWWKVGDIKEVRKRGRRNDSKQTGPKKRIRGPRGQRNQRR
ncbi:MAG: HVO_0476 family zinc finger protein [Thermoplasmatota archaeon]